MITLPDGVIRTKEGFYVLKDDTHLSRWIEEHKRLDVAKEEIMRFFAKYIPMGGVVVDAGASLGDHTATYAELVGPRGHVYAFEPNPLPSHALFLNFMSAANVTVGQFGLSDKREEVRMAISPNSGASHVSKDGDGPITVCHPLDEIIGGIDRLHFIHLDCEGYELKVISGAQKLLKKHRPVIVLEVNQGHLDRLGITQPEIWEYLESLNYRVQEIEPGANPFISQRDVVALPA